VPVRKLPMPVVVLPLTIAIGPALALARARALGLGRPRLVTPRYPSPVLPFRRHPARSPAPTRQAARQTAPSYPPTPSSCRRESGKEFLRSPPWTLSVGGGVGDDPLAPLSESGVAASDYAPSSDLGGRLPVRS
jgi:hypothetical protein